MVASCNARLIWSNEMARRVVTCVVAGLFILSAFDSRPLSYLCYHRNLGGLIWPVLSDMVVWLRRDCSRHARSEVDKVLSRWGKLFA